MPSSNNPAVMVFTTIDEHKCLLRGTCNIFCEIFWFPLMKNTPPTLLLLVFLYSEFKCNLEYDHAKNYMKLLSRVGVHLYPPTLEEVWDRVCLASLWLSCSPSASAFWVLDYRHEPLCLEVCFCNWGNYSKASVHVPKITSTLPLVFVFPCVRGRGGGIGSVWWGFCCCFLRQSFLCSPGRPDWPWTHKYTNHFI